MAPPLPYAKVEGNGWREWGDGGPRQKNLPLPPPDLIPPHPTLTPTSLSLYKKICACCQGPGLTDRPTTSSAVKECGVTIKKRLSPVTTVPAGARQKTN
jgi:hypothetical protein